MSGEGDKKQFKLSDDYNDVPQRIRDFRAKFPEGSLRCADPAVPYRLETVGEQTFLVYVAAAYRHPEDPAPGIGTAWEPVPGKTPYTRDSEMQNAETSAWGRAIIAALAADAKKIASAEDVEVANARNEERMRVLTLKRQIAAFGATIGWDVQAVKAAVIAQFGTEDVSADELATFYDDLQARHAKPAATVAKEAEPTVYGQPLAEHEAAVAALRDRVLAPMPANANPHTHYAKFHADAAMAKILGALTDDGQGNVLTVKALIDSKLKAAAA